MTIKWLARVVASLCVAVIATLIIAATALFIAMFSTPGEGSHRTEELWGGVFFQTVENGNSTILQLGVGNPWILVGICAALTVFFVYIAWIYSMLKKRREALLAMQTSETDANASTDNDGTSEVLPDSVPKNHLPKVSQDDDAARS